MNLFVFTTFFIFAYILLYVFHRETCPDNYEHFQGGKYNITDISEVVCAIEKQHNLKLISIFKAKRNGPNINVLFMAANDKFTAGRYKASVSMKDMKVKLGTPDTSQIENGSVGINKELKYEQWKVKKY